MRLALLMVLIAVFSATVASAQAPLGQGTLVFASTRALNYGASDLMTVDARGQRRNITQSPGIADADADISPDGQRIVFTRTEVGQESDLYTITTAGRQLRRLTSTPEQRELAAAFSPRNDAVAFIRETSSGHGDVWIKAGGAERRLTSTDDWKIALTWSPDGRRLAFVSETDSSLYVVARDGTGLRRLAPYSSAFARPPLVWLPTGLVVGVPAPNARVGLELLDPETGRTRPFQNPCGGNVPSYSTDRVFVVCDAARRVPIRTARGRRVRLLTLYPLNQSTFVGRTSLGPHARTLVFDASIDERDGDLLLLGSQLRRLTGGPGEDHSPALSPDRKLVAFVRSHYQEREGEGALLFTDTHGRAVRPLLGNRTGAHPTWAPDGKRVAYEQKGSIYVASLVTRRARRLTQGRGPSWSHDGRKIAFLRPVQEAASIWTVRSNGTGETKLVSRPSEALDLAWSPDGRSIAFSTGDTISVLAVADGTTRTLVSETDNNLSSPTWSPDGRKLAYASGWDNDIPYPWQAPGAHFLEIWAVDVATGARSPLISSAGFNYAPSWR